MAELKLCICGKMFTPYRKSQKYHNTACREKRNNKKYKYHVPTPIVTKLCKNCGTPFETNRINKVFHSTECYKEFDKNRLKDKEQRTCAYCHSPFETSHYIKKYCNDDCRRAARKIRNEVS